MTVTRWGDEAAYQKAKSQLRRLKKSAAEDARENACGDI
jgi:hypothetical protein